MAKALKTPTNRDQAVAMLETYNRLAGELVTIEANRNAAIAATNAVADGLALKIVPELAAIEAALAPWWPGAKGELLTGKRKSVELGGCMVGSALSSVSLEHSHADDKAAVAALRAETWTKRYVRVTYSLNRPELLTALDGGRHADQLAELGFKRKGGEDTFFVKRVAQAGTIAG